MSDDPDEILDGVFHACAFAAFLEQAHARQGWPDSEATRQRAYQLYEQALAEKNGRPKALAPRPARHYPPDP
jgi:hypothetical protein